MGEDLQANSGFGGSNQRKLMIGTIENILKEELPKNRDDVTATIMYKTGLTELKVRDYVRLFFRLGLITKDEDDDRVLVWVK